MNVIQDTRQRGALTQWFGQRTYNQGLVSDVEWVRFPLTSHVYGYILVGNQRGWSRPPLDIGPMQWINKAKT